MNNREIVCIVCPNGCRMNVVLDEQNRVSSVENALCRNGRAYATDEILCPKRSITSTVPVSGGISPLVSVRSSSPIPREKIKGVIEELKKLKLKAPVGFHQKVVSNVLGTGADIITTKQVLESGKN